MKHIKVVPNALDLSKHDCLCGLIPLVSKGHHFPSCVSGFSTPEMVPIASFEAVKCNKTMVKDETEITNIVQRYKPIVGAMLHWTGEKGLKDIGGQCDECGEEETKKGILTKIL